MIFSLKDLYIKKDYTISRQIEQVLLDGLIKLYALKQEDVEISQGCNSEFDFRIKDKLFELKIMSTSFFNIEVSRENGDPSGLSASKSDYYIIVNPGYLFNKELMKIRIVKTDALRKAVASSTKVKVYGSNEHNSLGSVCHQIDPKIPHDFIGSYPIEDKIGKDYFVDFSKFTSYGLKWCDIKMHDQL